jgi:tRNA threonylcarbamoyladenosine biosynthesis protein TsaE
MAGADIVSRSEEETREFGARLASALPDGTVVALAGELGAGKTTLVQGAARGLGVVTRKGPSGEDEDGEEESGVISPTFVLVREHVSADGRKLVHVDAHRLAGAWELTDLGSDDFLGRTGRQGDGRGGLAFVEWADRVYDALPRPCLVIRMSHEAEATRRLSLGGIGPGHEALVDLAARAVRKNTDHTKKDDPP